MTSQKKLLSIVIPVYNEQDGIATFHNTILLPAISRLPIACEIIYVNDGSKDDTLRIMHKLKSSASQTRIVNLSRNFGKEIALTAGITQARGDAIIMLDADGQHPPKLIKEFLERWQKGAQVVIGVRGDSEKQTLTKRLGSAMFYKLFNLLSGTDLVPRSTDFRLIDKLVQTEFIRCTERDRITRGIIDWLGFERSYVKFEAPARLAGTANYSTRKLIQLATNSFVSLSLKPLFFFGWVGLFITIVSVTLGLYIIVEQLFMGDPLGIHFSGSFMLGVFMSFMVGLVLMSQSILAVYLSHIHKQAQDRPLFIINKKGSANL